MPRSLVKLIEIGTSSACNCVAAINTNIRSLYHHVFCNAPVSCKAYGDRNPIGTWLDSEANCLINMHNNTIYTFKRDHRMWRYCFPIPKGNELAPSRGGGS